MPSRTLIFRRRAPRAAASLGLTALVAAALAACLPVVPPLTAPPVALTTSDATFVGDGYQHGPAGSSTADVVRDSALPASMPDGYTLQVYSDTTSMPGAQPWYFQTNSAALSPAGGAGQTLEAAPDGHPVSLLPWTAAEAAAVRPGISYIGVWPSGAVWVPASVSGGNRVLVTYNRVLVDASATPPTFTVLGQGVAEILYTNAADALAQGIQATRINDDLLPGDNAVTMGSPVFDRGWVYLYGCGATITCFGARVRPNQIHDRTAWRWFDGTGWAGARANRQPLAGIGEFSAPSVQWIPAYRAYAMSNSRTDDTVAVRWSSTPTGPWTAPQVLSLPGCGTSLLEGGCFGAVVRPESTTTAMVLTYAAYGEYRTRVAAVPVTPSPTPAPTP